MRGGRGACPGMCVCVWWLGGGVCYIRRMGEMSVNDNGVVQWVLPSGITVALQQICDILMVVAKGPTECLTFRLDWHRTMVTKKMAKNRSYGTEQLHSDGVCHGACMGSSLRCMSSHVSSIDTIAQV